LIHITITRIFSVIYARTMVILSSEVFPVVLNSVYTLISVSVPVAARVDVLFIIDCAIVQTETAKQCHTLARVRARR